MKVYYPSISPSLHLLIHPTIHSLSYCLYMNSWKCIIIHPPTYPHNCHPLMNPLSIRLMYPLNWPNIVLIYRAHFQFPLSTSAELGTALDYNALAQRETNHHRHFHSRLAVTSELLVCGHVSRLNPTSFKLRTLSSLSLPSFTHLPNFQSDAGIFCAPHLPTIHTVGASWPSSFFRFSMFAEERHICFFFMWCHSHAILLTALRTGIHFFSK